MFELWKDYSMVCPDFENSKLKDDTWHLRGSLSSFVIKRGEFVVERCRNTKDYDKCESDENIDKFINDLSIDTWVYQEKMDIIDYDTKPVFKITQFLNGNLMDNTEKLIRNIIFLKKEILATEDSFFQIGQLSEEGYFYTIANQKERYENTRDIHGKYKKTIYQQEVYLSQEEISHSRNIYDSIALLGNMGGIQGVLISLLCVFAAPINEHSFNIKMARKLFKAKSSTPGLFQDVPAEDKGSDFDEDMIQS